MKKAICPGTFDPITNGHIDIIQRAAKLFDRVIVAVVKKSSKNTMFSFEDRFRLVKESVKEIKGVTVEGFDGLMVEFAARKNVKAIVRGLRMISDFEYEFQMALTNRSLTDEVETLFLMPHPKYSYVSSRLIKEVAYLGADLDDLMPPVVRKAIKEKLIEGKG
jgi:pantetheine-phosphate adenylyltransferase